MPETWQEKKGGNMTESKSKNTELANTLTEIAKKREISSETLINAWLKEKIQEQI
ncbi:MAG: hypothetical protein ISS94_04595 [Candidatus Syntrophoarchaeum sp.]|nr:hypothetical protein [Candidatus Syntrophoarchaeum sp.]